MLLGGALALATVSRTRSILDEASPVARIAAEFLPIAFSSVLFGAGAWLVHLALGSNLTQESLGRPLTSPLSPLAITLTACHLAAIATVLLRFRPNSTVAPWVFATLCWLAGSALAIHPLALGSEPILAVAALGTLLDSTVFLTSIEPATLTRIDTLVDTMPTVALLLASWLVVDSRVHPSPIARSRS